jgi:hypothetical protein
MTLRAAVVVAVVALTGCTSTRTVESGQPSFYARINDTAEGRTARIGFIDGRTVQGMRLFATPDSVSFVDATGRARSVPTSDVEQIELQRARRGAFQGAGIGLLTGAATGGLIGATILKDPFSFTRAEMASITAALSGVIGASIGLGVGRARGSRLVYRFPHAPNR